MNRPEDITIGGFEIVDPDEPTERRARTPAASPYAVPLSTLIAGAYVGATEQIEVHPDAPPPGMGDDAGAAGLGGAGLGGAGFDGSGGE